MQKYNNKRIPHERTESNGQAIYDGGQMEFLRKFWADRINEDSNKCVQGLTLEDSIDRDSLWKKAVEAVKVIQGP